MKFVLKWDASLNNVTNSFLFILILGGHLFSDGNTIWMLMSHTEVHALDAWLAFDSSFLLMGTRREAVMVQVVGSLPCMWITEVEFVAPGFGLRAVEDIWGINQWWRPFSLLNKWIKIKWRFSFKFLLCFQWFTAQANKIFPLLFSMYVFFILLSWPYYCVSDWNTNSSGMKFGMVPLIHF